MLVLRGNEATHSRLKTEPKNRAITVEDKIITLYGILKSGVGREMRVDVVYNPRTVSGPS